MEIMSVLISLAFGAAGYLIINFWFQPIMEYKKLKLHLFSDLIYYTNVIQVEQKNLEESSEFKKHVFERVDIMRRHSSDFVAANRFLPKFYKQYLRLIKKENLLAASKELTRLSNTNSLIEGMFNMENINSYLNLKLFDVIDK